MLIRKKSLRDKIGVMEVASSAKAETPKKQPEKVVIKSKPKKKNAQKK